MPSTAASTHKRQKAYVNHIKSEGFDFGVTMAQAFVRSIRDLGYKSAATALDELVDNAIEAGAENIHIAFGYTNSDAKPASIAIIDDGYGMVPEMIRAAVVWGGTDREGSRNLFGRYGYGLPSASVSQGKRFSVYSRSNSRDFHRVTFDVDELGDGKYLVNNRVVIPEPVSGKLPEWVTAYIGDHFSGGFGRVRTVIIWEKLDRLTWRTTRNLETNLLQHFGLVYRSFLRQTTLFVNSKKVEPIDPLFTTPGHRFFDYDTERAEALPPIEFDVKDDSGKPRGRVRMRLSYMRPTFLRKDKFKKATAQNANPRFAIRKENSGVIVCRNGRQIDVVSRSPLTTFVNNDRYIGMELDFPADLDEDFGVTTAKQQIVMSDRMWELLKQHGFMRTLDALRKRYREEEDDLDVGQQLEQQVPLASERVMEEVDGLIRKKPRTEEREVEADENFQREVERIAKETGVPPEIVAEKKHEEVRTHPYKVKTERIADGAFYRVEQVGGQLVVYINTAHRFFTDVYSRIPDPEGRRIRAALECLLFVLGECELETTKQIQIWYHTERAEWSRRFNAVLTILEDYIGADLDFPDIDEPVVSDI